MMTDAFRQDIMEKYNNVFDEEEKEVVLGEGAYGVVKLVEQANSRQLYARKSIRYCRRATRPGETTKNDIEREYNILRRMDHPNIVKYIDIEWPPQKRVAKLYMEYCAGKNLQSIIDECKTSAKRLTEGYVCKAFIELSDAVAYCHCGPGVNTDTSLRGQKWAPILHRDVKPLNVIQTLDSRTGEPIFKLVDFGLGTILKKGQPAMTYVGTKLYMAPEIGSPHFVWTEKCDIFSFGCTLYALCMLEPPFVWRMGRATEPLRPISDRYSASLRQRIMKCLQYSPEKRPDALFLSSHFWFPSSLGYYDSTVGDTNNDMSPDDMYATVESTLHDLEALVQSEFFEHAEDTLKELEAQDILQRMQLEKERAFWNPFESMNKKDTS